MQNDKQYLETHPRFKDIPPELPRFYAANADLSAVGHWMLQMAHQCMMQTLDATDGPSMQDADLATVGRWMLQMAHQCRMHVNRCGTRAPAPLSLHPLYSILSLSLKVNIVQ